MPATFVDDRVAPYVRLYTNCSILPYTPFPPLPPFMLNNEIVNNDEVNCHSHTSPPVRRNQFHNKQSLSDFSNTINSIVLVFSVSLDLVI